MSNFKTVNIFDMIEAIGEDKLNSILSDYSCPQNPEIEDFVKNKSIDFAKRKISITYFVVEQESSDIISFFTLYHKALFINKNALTSKTSIRNVERYATFDETSNSYSVSAFLIAQFGKNFSDSIVQPHDWNGTRLMEKALETLCLVQRTVGGGIVYLECEDKPKLLEFYENEQIGFHQFGTRFSGTDNITYIQLLRFF